MRSFQIHWFDLVSSTPRIAKKLSGQLGPALDQSFDVLQLPADGSSIARFQAGKSGVSWIPIRRLLKL